MGVGSAPTWPITQHGHGVATAGYEYCTTTPKSIAATCTTAGATWNECTVCHYKYDYTTVPKLGHNYTGTSNRVKSVADCDNPQYNYNNCIRCGDTSNITTYYSVGNRLGHIYTVDDSVVTTVPTVYNSGVRTFTCQRDNSHIATGIEPALMFNNFVGGNRIKKISKGNVLIYNTYVSTDSTVISGGISEVPPN